MTPVKQRWLSSRRQETYSHLVSTHLLTAAFCLEYMPLCEAGDIAIQDAYFTPIIMRSYNFFFFFFFLFVGFLVFSIKLDSFFLVLFGYIYGGFVFDAAA